MALLDRHIGKILLALISLSALAILLFIYDLQQTVRKEATPPPRPISTNPEPEPLQVPELKPKEHYDLVAKRNIFVFPDETKQGSSTDEAEAVETSINAQLKGTVVAPTGFVQAIIEDRSQRKESLFGIGDRIQDAEILEILKDRVILRRADRKETLSLFQERETTGARRSSSGRARTSRSEIPPTPARTSPPTAPSQAQRQTQRKIQSLMAQLRLRPHTQRGQPAGFVIGQVRKNSVFEATGLQQGDVIVAINDLEVMTPNQLLRAYREVAAEEELWVEVVRDGRDEGTFEIDLREIVTRY